MRNRMADIRKVVPAAIHNIFYYTYIDFLNNRYPVNPWLKIFELWIFTDMKDLKFQPPQTWVSLEVAPVSATPSQLFRCELTVQCGRAQQCRAQSEPRMSEARGKAAAVRRELLGSAKQYSLYQRCIRLTLLDLGTTPTYQHCPRMEFVCNSGTYRVIILR